MSKKRMITKSVIFLLILAFILKIFSSLSITMGYNANPLYNYSSYSIFSNRAQSAAFPRSCAPTARKRSFCWRIITPTPPQASRWQRSSRTRGFPARSTACPERSGSSRTSTRSGRLQCTLTTPATSFSASARALSTTSARSLRT